MKKLLLFAAMMLLSFFVPQFSPVRAAEGDYDFENENNFDAYNAGNGKIHVKVLIFSERGYDYNAGRGNNQHLGNDPDPICEATGSRLHTQLTTGAETQTIQMHYWGDNYYNNPKSSGSHHWPKSKGCVWVQLWGGVIECTNTFDGTKRTIVPDGNVVQVELKRKEEGNYLTWFEFDWYPPEDMDEKDFKLFVTSDHHKWNQSGFETKEYDFGVFTGADEAQAPIISDPFFYAANDKGAAGYGKLAYVYSLTTDVKQYFTTQDATSRILMERSDMLFVEPADSVQHGFRACFYALRDVDKATWRWVWSNKIDIPAYHKIHNFKVNQWVYHREDIDKWYEDYRYKKLTWQIYYPQEEDVMEGDYIEIQRAYNADFSDAQTINLVQMYYDSTATVNDIQTYTYVDSTEAAWWNPVEKNYNIYYRVRRTSSSIWEWEVNPYAAQGYLDVVHTYSVGGFFKVGINPDPVTYELDPDFSNNRAVHFEIDLFATSQNATRTQAKPGYALFYWDDNQKLIIRKILVEQKDTFLIEIPNDSIKAAINRQFYSPDDEVYNTMRYHVYMTDYANTPCTHYKYEAYIDTTGITVKDLNGREQFVLPVLEAKGREIYYTAAANISSFAGTDEEFSEYVLLTWDATEGDVGTYSVEARPNSESSWTKLTEGIKQNWFQDSYANPQEGNPWQYRLTMSYECNGNVLTRSVETTGRRNPYGKISGRITYADGTGCPHIEVNASRVSDGVVLQRVLTDESGYYLLDSVPYIGDAQYAITPVSQTATFHYNNTSATFATITLSLDHCVANGIDFENISSVRVSGRLLYENSTIPVRGAHFLVNGQMVRVGGHKYNTDAAGHFEFSVPKGEAFTLQAVKDGHWFAGDGFVRLEGDSLISLNKALDGIRIYDQTKVRLIGRLAGGEIQGSKPLGFGLSTNYLGEDLKMVFELEGDNISQIVHVPSDLDKDTIQQFIDSTSTLFEKKRITIMPSISTGEYAVDLYPVRYKITQATARGYATLFTDGKTSETLDLSDAAKHHKESIYNNDTVHYNEDYSIIYHSPIHISCKQLSYSRELDYFGEKDMVRKNITNEVVKVPLATKRSDGTYEYLFGAPVFDTGDYSFRITAHEDYYYNNDEMSIKHEEVRIHGGQLKVYNGLHDDRNTQISTYQLDENGKAEITLPVDYVSFIKTGEEALRVLDLSVEYQGEYVEKQAIKAYVTGNRPKGRDFVTSTHGNIILLDILRDPPGSQSYAYIEEGTTYKYNYSYKFDFKFGLNVTLGYGAQTTLTMGAYVGSPFGSYAGYVSNFSTENKFDLPISSSYLYHKTGSYTFTTNSRIETDNEKYFVDQTGNGKYFVGQEADVYIGAVQNMYYGITDAVKPIDSLTYASLRSRDIYGAMRIVSMGRDKDKQLWYLVIGEETEVGTYLNSSFVYTHDYIENTLLPQLRKQRNELLYTGDSATVQAIANAKGKPVYLSTVNPDNVHFADSGYYKMIVPVGDTKLYDNQVDAYNRQIAQWIDKFIQNETEKVNAIYGNRKQKVGTWSVSGGTLVSHNETYEYGAMYTKRIDYPGGSFNLSQGLISTVKNAFGTSIGDQIAGKWLKDVGNNEPYEIVTNTPTSHLIFDVTPILSLDVNYNPETGTTHTKKTGFVLEPDNFGHESVSVYRVVNTKDEFNSGSEDIRDFISDNDYGLNLIDGKPDSLYGAYVYFLEGGASRCPYEQAYTTSCYEPAMPLSAGTMNLENQKLDINVHERSNVPADQPAVFQLRLTNESDGDFGGSAAPISFYLKQKEGSNPHGARLIVDGMPLTGDGRAVKISHDEVITKTLQVYAGEGYDYENIILELASPCDPYNKVACTFSVHYLPVSCPVNITTPHDKWVQNTLSSQDSIGYYLPVTIDGFDVNYNGFDHIEFQYKLSTQSDDAWVNQCSYYYDDSLYNMASGNKAMITSGRIENIRFYGERDPMEQQYDLRAVSFCRYGNGFINRASTVLTGIKDTRPPRVFGQPEPANSTLGVGDNLLLRFNEAIAGNYLDEDNNFQVLGVTNDFGITTSSAIHFDGTANSYAETKVSRSLADKSFSIEMMVKPDVLNQDEVFFMHGSGNDLLLFGKTYDNRLTFSVGLNETVLSKPLDSPMKDFTRVIVTYDHEKGEVRFYAGTKEMTDQVTTTFYEHNAYSPFTFGMGYAGSILEARIWTKALTQAEIANTADHYLTGYERELLAYYPLNEGKGDILNDKANRATLFAHGTSWAKAKGISLHIPANQTVKLAGDLFSRASIQDETLMFWFRTTSQNGTLFSAASNFRLAIEEGYLVMYSENAMYPISNVNCANGDWHHIALTVNRTYNNVALFIDDSMVLNLKSDFLSSISGSMTLGGNGFEGNIDELALFEQALPKALVEEYYNLKPYGDEMGLMAYLPFEETKESSQGIMEVVFSPNDQRQFKDGNGKIINKVVPLLLEDYSLNADKMNYAPVHNQGQLTKLNFDWAFNNDELMINILNPDYEVNKQPVFITVRDVEDLNGNPMASPVTWTAFVDRNALKWEDDDLDFQLAYGEETNYNYIDFQIINQSGKRHQYTIESLPSWLSVDQVYGTIAPMQDKAVRFYFDTNTPVGEYLDLVYLTDENGLSEPLEVELSVKAYPPYDAVDKGKYPLNMSVCGKVLIDDQYDTDPNDIVYAICRNECIATSNVTVNPQTNTSELYLTIYGNEELNGKTPTFLLWQASTGKTYTLTPSTTIRFKSGNIIGCGLDEPVIFNTGGALTQNIPLNAGWNWVSFNLDLQPSTAQLTKVLTANKPWTEGDIIKNPATQHFVTYSEENDAFLGQFSYLRYIYSYMVYSKNDNLMRVSGKALPQDSAHVLLRGNSWNALPCLLSQITELSEALADYYNFASPGDIVKSHDQFAVFSADKHWVGDLKALRPGEGYFLKRTASTDVDIHFFNKPISAPAVHHTPYTAHRTPSRAATNMTMICALNSEAINAEGNKRDGVTINAYIGNDLVGKATKIDDLYFLTISCDNSGVVRFETEDGQKLNVQINEQMVNDQMVNRNILYVPDSHYGSLTEPVLLVPDDANRVYKIIENDHVVIIRNNEKYDVTGTKLK